ncbi:unnamed protein product [Kluyveromyces dobzhanskii CBS 2104]|uniref:WGS project CCBQ000000000 data, contig 00011 n=1 Tax=Kluyveromyces dobzhanskii CBS 2104 TaxID=1427455 RepID=A0A0A8L7K2_9SACH|nr:unnamed protein product [Kluyveromyces dobzhanskii CBS 2104]
MVSDKIPKLSNIDTSSLRSTSGAAPSVGETPLGAGFQPQRAFPLFICITEYSKRMDDELDMKPGDKIQVVTDDGSYNDGWYFGRNLRTQEEGLYPKVFTQVIAMERKPALMRAKSSKRIASPLATGSNTNLSYRSQDGSTSELPTPQPLETAQPAVYKKFQHVKAPELTEASVPVDRNISMKSTMSDIDKALEELRGDSFPSTTDSIDTTQGPPLRRLLSGSSLDFTKNNSVGNSEDSEELDIKNVKKWTPEQVTAYLISMGFDVDSASRFQKHKISGTILLELELTHLKELEINSFGTRFEIFKEIEALKEISNQNATTFTNKGSSLMPAASFSQNAEISITSPSNHDIPTYRGHLRKTSQSMEELTSNSTPTPKTFVTPSSAINTKSAQKPRPASLLFTNETTKAPDISEDVFASPRRAPKPPSYPSPVQPPKSPMVASSGVNSNGRFLSPQPNGTPSSQGSKYAHPTIYEQVSDSKVKAQAEMLSQGEDDDHNHDQFEFPPKKRQGPSSNTASLPNPYNKEEQSFERNPSPTVQTDENRGSVVYSGHAKTKSGGSFVELFNRISMLSENTESKQAVRESDVDTGVNIDRPSSSLYAHSRATSYSTTHGRKPSQANSERKHRRNSSLLSFFKEKDEQLDSDNAASKSSRRTSASHSRKNSFVSPFRTMDNGTPSQRHSMMLSTSPVKDLQASQTRRDSKRRSVSAKEPVSDVFYDAKDTYENDVNQNRSVSESNKPKSNRTASAKNLGKQRTTAFTEGIRSITINEAMREAECSGWMSKKGTGAMGVWKNRFFTLHGTRLSYFTNTTDNRERGLIDITAHRVLPAKEDDKFVSLYAASTGKGRYCFKLVPPQPGSKKGLTFTQPRVHYFAVDTKDEMRAWIAALIKATIDIDTSVPIISSCATPTVSLTKAQEMLSQAREETRLREQQRSLNENDEDTWDQQRAEQTQTSEDFANMSSPSMTHNTTITSGLTSPYLMADQLASNMTAGTVNSSTGSKTPSNQNAEYFGLDPKFLNGRI